MNREHGQVCGLLRNYIVDLNTARDEKKVSETLDGFANLASMYAPFANDVSVFWRKTFRMADESSASDDTFHRLMVWAGVLEIQRLTP